MKGNYDFLIFFQVQCSFKGELWFFVFLIFFKAGKAHARQQEERGKTEGSQNAILTH